MISIMKQSNHNNSKINFLSKAGAVIAALAFWQIAAMRIHQKILLVSPWEVFLRLTTIWQVKGFVSSIGFTFGHIVLGFVLGLVSGMLFAFLASRFSLVDTLLWPWVVTIKSVPVASFVIICLIWLSAGNLSVFISFLIVFPVVYQNLLTGLRSTDPKMQEMAKIFRLPWYRKLLFISLPQLEPYLRSACSLSIGMSWKAGVAAEIIGTPDGSIGQMLYYAKIYLDTDDLLAWTVIIVLISICFEKLFVFCLKRLFALLYRI